MCKVQTEHEGTKAISLLRKLKKKRGEVNKQNSLGVTPRRNYHAVFVSKDFLNQ